MDRGLVFDVAPDLVDVKVRVVLEVLGEAMVLLDDRIEDNGEVLVGIGIASIDAAVLVIELNSAGNGLGKGEAGGLGLDVGQLLPLLWAQVLGDQALGGADGGEWRDRGLSR